MAVNAFFLDELLSADVTDGKQNGGRHALGEIWPGGQFGLIPW